MYYGGVSCTDRSILVQQVDDQFLWKAINMIAQTDFELRNDCGIISNRCWEVTWYEDYVEVILSGEEQFDERVTLYFDGSVVYPKILQEEAR